MRNISIGVDLINARGTDIGTYSSGASLGLAGRCLNEIFANECGDTNSTNGANGQAVAEYVKDNITSQRQFQLLRLGDYINFPSISIEAVEAGRWTDANNVGNPAYSAWSKDFSQGVDPDGHVRRSPSLVLVGYDIYNMTATSTGYCVWSFDTCIGNAIACNSSCVDVGNKGGWAYTWAGQYLASVVKDAVVAMLGFTPISIRRQYNRTPSKTTAWAVDNVGWKANYAQHIEQVFIPTKSEIVGIPSGNGMNGAYNAYPATTTQFPLYVIQPHQILKTHPQNFTRQNYWTCTPALNIYGLSVAGEASRFKSFSCITPAVDDLRESQIPNYLCPVVAF